MEYSLFQEDGAARRLLRAQEDLLSQVVDSPRRAIDLFKGIEDENNVKLMSLQLNGSLEVLDCEVISVGPLVYLTGHSAITVLRGAVTSLAKAVILMINRVEGNALPTKKERQFYEKIVATGRELDVEVLDMIIISRDDAFTFAHENKA